MLQSTPSRLDGRSEDALRSVEVIPNFQRNAEGSVLYRAGGTVVLCTASVDPKVPPFLEGKGKGWLTAEYQMHPRASPARREARDGRGKAPSGRTQEIQRLVGRALRAAVDLEKLGERTITLDCDVLEADGGTRTASVTGGFIALCLALSKIKARGMVVEPVLREPVAATSVGCLSGDRVVIDLAYAEDSTAEFDLNVVATASGAIIEVQGTAEAAPLARKKVDEMIDLALRGVSELVKVQRAALARAGVELETLLMNVRQGR
jgi:ribonuclease PH